MKSETLILAALAGFGLYALNKKSGDGSAGPGGPGTLGGASPLPPIPGSTWQPLLLYTPLDSVSITQTNPSGPPYLEHVHANLHGKKLGDLKPATKVGVTAAATNPHWEDQPFVDHWHVIVPTQAQIDALRAGQVVDFTSTLGFNVDTQQGLQEEYDHFHTIRVQAKP